MMRQDFRLAIRCLCATPVITAVAILSLALGIGANTAVFSLVDSLLLRELRVVDPDRLTLLSTGAGDEHQQYSNLTVDQIRRYATNFDGVCAWAYPGRRQQIRELRERHGAIADRRRLHASPT